MCELANKRADETEEATYFKKQLHTLRSKLTGESSKDVLRNTLDERRRTMKKLEKQVHDDRRWLWRLAFLLVGHLLVLVARSGLCSRLDRAGEEEWEAVGELLQAEHASACEPWCRKA